MAEIDLKQISGLMSVKLGKPIVLTASEKVGSGYHSDGFKLTAQDGTCYFLKYIKSHDLGFEFPERRIASLHVSDGMNRRAQNSPAALGVIVSDQGKAIMLPELTETTQVYEIQEYGEGDSVSYSKILADNISKTHVDDEDRTRLEAIADLLVKIHSHKHPATDPQRLAAVYNDGIRNMLTNPELSVMVLSEFPNDYQILDLDGQKEIIGLMYENIKAWMGRSDRLTALHGDFWGANIFFRPDGTCWVIDFSRIPWGDPAIDAGWFMSQFLWYYHSTGNPYFRELIDAWLDIYGKKSGDEELLKAIPLVLGWIGIVQIYPRWFPDIDVKIGRKFINHIKDILKQKRFVWDD